MPRRKTTEEFVADLGKVNPNITVIGEYINCVTPIECKCRKCGHEWSAWPSSLLRGGVCRKCSSEDHAVKEDEFIQLLNEEKPEVELIGGYTRMSKTATFRCKECGHEWTAKANVVLRSTGCPECSVRKRGIKRRKTHAQFAKEMHDAHPNIKLLSEYVNCSTEIKVACSDCGHEWSQRPTSLLNGVGCHYCNNSRRVPESEFLSKLSKNNPLVIPVGKYCGVSKKMTFKCGICGNEWDTLPSMVLRGSGCRKCAHVQTSFFECALLNALQQILGEDKVLWRSTNAIGIELDIFIPSLNLAFEPGGWHFHKDVIENDDDKAWFCHTAGIKFVTFYFGCDDDTVTPPWAESTTDSLGVQDWDNVTKTIRRLLEEQGLSCESVDWEKVRAFGIANSKRKTTAQFCDELEAINPDIEVLGEYVSSLSKIRVRCKTCQNEWEATPHNLLQGKGCPACKWSKISSVTRKSHEQFVEDARKACPTLEILGTYVKSSEKVLVRCRLCGRTYESKATNILSGKACTSCSRKKSHADFLKDLAEKNPLVEALGRYQSSDTPIAVRCTVCGHTWNANPRALMSGVGCQKCAWKTNGENMRNSNEEFLERLGKINPNVKPLGEYVTASKSIPFKCLVCGNEWNARPSNILSGRQCPECAKEKVRKLNVERGRNRFLSFMEEKHPTIEVTGKYTGANSGIEVKCKVCGRTWTSSPTNLYKSPGCRLCRSTKA